MTMKRRKFLELAVFGVPGGLGLAQAVGVADSGKRAMVPAGEDREGKKHAVGVSSTTYKVLTAETGGAMFVMEQLNHKKGGPSRHLHHTEDELFYVMEGEYLVEIGGEPFRLKAGDCVLGPKGVPHAWAFVGEGTGRLLISYAPAGKMEAFFNEREHMGIKPGGYAVTASDAEILRKFGMELVGPPLEVS
jgi:mannose-6-phosphate isomerase-like protein (cupin superfamily)